MVGVCYIRFGNAVQEQVATVETRTEGTKGEHQKSANVLVSSGGCESCALTEAFTLAFVDKVGSG